MRRIIFGLLQRNELNSPKGAVYLSIFTLFFQLFGRSCEVATTKPKRWLRCWSTSANKLAVCWKSNYISWNSILTKSDNYVSKGGKTNKTDEQSGAVTRS